MNKNRIFSGIVGVIVGSLLFSILIDLISKPSNFRLKLEPIDSFNTYYFSFVYGLGTVGVILGTLLLLGYLVFFYFIGTWIYELIAKEK